MSKGVARFLAAVAAGIDSEPIATELTWPMNKKRIRINDIEIHDGKTPKHRKLILHVTPIFRELP